MRGDRPSTAIDCGFAIVAAPHARGSTRRQQHRERRGCGCPACAGIDPGGLVSTLLSHRLPRMRGDRPFDGMAAGAELLAAPHARGSTLKIPVVVAAQIGCPACAGIDPSISSTPTCAPRLPRMRGDRPWPALASGGSIVAAPHARGSTPRRLTVSQLDGGCPACAGIDPARAVRRRGSSRLPRMRGDRPFAASVRAARPPAAPHARGSTQGSRPHRRDPPGCPACAGIDPRASARPSRRPRLPRMRGDRPECGVVGQIRTQAAPHARGSTHRDGAGRDRERGCPACAGIDPSSARGSRQARRLPRMRGDRPIAGSVAIVLTPAAPHARGSTFSGESSLHRRVGCPACAGIDPKSSERSPTGSRLPRMRGDRPRLGRGRAGRGWAAPHARGSTPDRVIHQPIVAGCPACAGIDPYRNLPAAAPQGLPRMRGDRPDARSADGSTERAAPHARGSTQGRSQDRARRAGCPACAGIDPCPASLTSTRARLPRMRGDRPASAIAQPWQRTAAPHARGSTRAGVVARHGRRGCPACAGIDPLD